MNTSRIKRSLTAIGCAAALLGLASCGDDISKDGAPVVLVVTYSATVQVMDFDDPTCGASGIGTLNVEARVKRTDADPRFLDVKITTMRVRYRRIDGGTVVPPDFVQPYSQLISSGSSNELSGFISFAPGTFQQAPFVAIRPENGGHDPETGKTSVSLERTIEVYGETLAGEKVMGSVTTPLSFCYQCGCVQTN
jgi:hypothetical protein